MKIFWTIIRRIAILLLVVVAFVGGALAVLTLTQTGRDGLANLISGLASTPGQSVAISGLSGIWANPTRIENVTIGDTEGPWLALRGVSIDWTRMALLSSTFEAERVSAERIEVARSPKPVPADDDANTQPASLPVSLKIKSIDLPDVALGSALVGGRVASISAKGSATVVGSPLSVQARLSAARSDGTEGDLDATIDFVPATNLFNLDLHASEPSGGIIAGLLSLPGKPRVDLDVAGKGSAADWNGKGTFAVDGNIITTLAGRYRLTDAGHVVDVKGDGAFGGFLPQRFQDVLAGNSSFDIAGTVTNSGGAVVERARLESGAVTASASGTVDPAGASDFTLDLSAREPAGVALSFGTEESPIDLAIAAAKVRVTGSGQAPTLDVSAQLPSVTTNVTKLSGLDLQLHSDNFDLTARSGPFDGTASADAVVIDNPDIAPLVSGRVRAGLKGTLEPTLLTVAQGTLASDALDGAFDGTVSLDSGRIALNLKADALSAALPAQARRFLGDRAQISTALTRDADGNVSAEALSLRSGNLSVDGLAKIAPQGIDVDLKGAFADVSILAPQATGAIGFAVKATGAMTVPELALTVTSDKLTVAARDITGLELTASGTADLANPSANVTLKGNVAGQPLAGNAVLKSVDGRSVADGLSLTLGANRIEGDLTLDSAFVPNGRITFDLPDIGPLAALALETVEGDLKGSVDFTNESGKPRAQVTATSGRIVRGDVSASAIGIEATVSDFLATPVVSGTLRAGEAKSGATVVRDTRLTLSQDGAWTRFDGAASLDGNPVAAAGRVKLDQGVTTVELASANGAFRGIEARLARPSTVTVAGGQASLEQLGLAIGGGSVTLSGTAGSTLNLTATLSGLPATLANGFAPGIGAAGTISGTVKATGTASAPNVAYTVDWSGAETVQTRSAGFGAMSIRSSGTFAGGSLKFDASVGDGSGLTLKGGGTVNTAASPPALALDFSGAVPLSFLTARLAAQGLALSGASNVTLSVRGPASSPQVGGSIRASGLRFVDSRSGIAVDGITADIGLANGRATINRLTGTLSTGGTLTASGSVGIDAGAGFPADLSIRIADGRYTDGQVVTTTMSGALAIKGSLIAGPALTGTVDLGRTVITVPDRLPSSLATLDVKHKNAPSDVRAQEKALNRGGDSGKSSGGLTLDLTVSAPQQIFVQGRGLDAELGGSVRLTGSVSAPQAVGQFTLRRGRLSILGRRLTFSRGTLGFSGSLVPYLDLAADSTVNDATVTVLVTGPANNPKFAFSSIPLLPEDEVLARLVFGRSMSNLSPIQIAQLADAAAQFSGAGGTTSLLNTLRGKLGVDDLDIKTDEKGGTALSAGKYLNDRTYITIEKGDRAGSGKAAIDLNVGRGVKLRGEATDAGEAKGGIFYEKEY